MRAAAPRRRKAGRFSQGVESSGFNDNVWLDNNGVPLQYQADDELIEYICNGNNKYFEVVKDAVPPGRPAPRK